MFKNEEKNASGEMSVKNGADKEQRGALVHEDQESMFGAEEAFSESMVVEKQSIDIDSSANAGDSEDSFGDTAVFTFAKDKPAGSEIEHEELSVGELQDTAKNYYNATHAESIEDKIGDLRKLAVEDFEELPDEDEVVIPSKAEIRQEKKKRKLEKKKRKRGIVSDDDIALLSGVEDTADMAEDNVAKAVGKTSETVVQTMETEEDNKEISGVFDEATGSTEYANPFGVPEEEEETEEEKLMKALGGKSKEYKSFESVFGDDEPNEEYTDKSQETAILKGLRGKAIFSMISVIISLAVAALCVYFEVTAGTQSAHPYIFEPGKFGVTYALSMLQIMFVGIIFNFDGIKRAFKGLRPSKASVEGFCAVVLMVCTLHTIMSCIMVADSSELRSFCSIGCLALVFLSVNTFIKSYTALTSFCIAASKAPKTSCFALDRTSNEAGCFEKYLDKDTSVMTVGKGSFVTGFFKKTYSVPGAGNGTFRMSVIMIIFAIIAGVARGVITENIYSGVCTFTVCALAALPVNALISTALPFLLASAKAKKTQTAYIGEAACDAYENCGVISFDDTEVFPPKSVKVSSIRTYSENRIDKVILYMAKIFEKIEGPLSFVFSNSVQSLEQQSLEAQILEHFSNGISVRLDGKEILVGTAEFMRIYDVETTVDNIDDSFTQSLGSIMYMSVDGALAAKFYIKYYMNRNFEAVLHSFYDAGICVGIKTLDPCITTELVCANLKGSNYPVAVIKNYLRAENSGVAEETEGAVVSLSGIHNFLKGFIRLDNLRNIYRTNTTISTISGIIGLILASLMSFAGASGLSVFFILVLQIFWCIPTIIFSVFSK